MYGLLIVLLIRINWIIMKKTKNIKICKKKLKKATTKWPVIELK